MVTHTWKKLDSFPLAFVVVFAVGIFLPFIISLIKGHVTPYVPYISEGGGLFPEAGIFSICISISTILSFCVMCLRYLVVEQLISRRGYDITTFFNKISFALGTFSSIAMLLVAAYPASTIAQVHNSAAGAACVCYVLHLVFQTWITFRILGRTKLTYLRLVITVFTALAVIFVTTFGVLGSLQWTAAHWAGKKTPQDKGFAFYVVSASSEWIMAILLMAFFCTYICEFKKSSFKFRLEIGDQTESRPRLSNLDIRHP